MARKPLIAGNWKMNLDHQQAIGTVQKLAFALHKDYYEKVDVAVTVPFTDLRSVQTLVEGDKLQITYGAQDVSPHESGAYTGEVSASMLAKLNCSWVVVGHSERREYHNETNQVIAAKLAAAYRHELTPMLCVGEGLDVRKAGEHVAFTLEQLAQSLEGVSAEQAENLVIAYEPVWAIGTGEVAGPADAQEMCAAIRGALAERFGTEIAEKTQLLYGGSVKAANAASIMRERDVDGVLVGGASLDAEEFANIVRFEHHLVTD